MFGRFRAKRFIDAVEKGEFSRILKDATPAWWAFLRRAAWTPHVHRVFLQYRYLDDEADGPQSLWIAYALEDSDQPDTFGLRLEWVALPNPEDPDTFNNPPEEIDHEWTFVYPPDPQDQVSGAR
ncbi:MAG: hypothetical protein ACRDH8_08225 [Actinomycetota bacterium]